MIDQSCVFCDIVAERAPATVIRAWPETIAITPISPVTPGHVLVLPRTHVSDVADDPDVSGLTMTRAAELAAEHPAANIITSRGAAATQSIFHLHLHVVPRAHGDALPLPWTLQR
ncbi:hydrolase [Acrocarpospora phusangensis]|uniref:Hydrolase n=1 Tax=Acrocarpospora phusangensis TaxID=1070424 RepID=A0A919QG69_9ACTN|nr:HIT domain-containing protein [Acrocarpospora phusangensis]GIH26820.1 hydrolase [Acrocarpospora phusangensis]